MCKTQQYRIKALTLLALVQDGKSDAFQAPLSPAEGAFNPRGHLG